MSERRLHLAGWALFVVCAVCYLAAAWRAADPWSVVGSVIFLAGCIAFLIPLLRAPEDEAASPGPDGEG
ncbi:MAG: cytochrome oxidase subunit III [Actinomycetota bacterium]|nr:cytochrome oxidase subunit III [Actinomycetota bacterium]